MSKDTERQKIYQMLRDGWTEATHGPIMWENTPFEQPRDKLWIAVFILDVPSFQGSLPAGTTLFRHPGILQIDIMNPLDKGTKALNDAIDLLTTIYRNKDVNTSDNQRISFKTPQTRNLGEQNGFWRFNFRVEYERDEYA